MESVGVIEDWEGCVSRDVKVINIEERGVGSCIAYVVLYRIERRIIRSVSESTFGARRLVSRTERAKDSFRREKYLSTVTVSTNL